MGHVLIRHLSLPVVPVQDDLTHLDGPLRFLHTRVDLGQKSEWIRDRESSLLYGERIRSEIQTGFPGFIRNDTARFFLA